MRGQVATFTTLEPGPPGTANAVPVQGTKRPGGDQNEEGADDVLD